MGSSQCDYNTPLIIDEFSDYSNVKKIWNQTKKHLPKHDIILFDKMPDRINDKKNFLIKNISCDHIYNYIMLFYLILGRNIIKLYQLR